MKKLLIALLAGALTFGLVACSEDVSDKDDSFVDTDNDSTADDDTDVEDDADVDTDVDADVDTDTDVDTDVDTGTDFELTEIENWLIEISQTADVSEDYLAMLAGSGATTPITEDMEFYFLGSDAHEYAEAYAFEPMMSSQAFSMLIVRANTAEEANDLAEAIKSTVDPVKWVCVSVEADDVKSAVSGDLVFIVMAEDSEKFVEAFETVVAE